MLPTSVAPPTRRRFIGAGLAAGMLASAFPACRVLAQSAGPFTLPPLPYAENALAPVISSQHDQLSLRQASPGLCRQPEQGSGGLRPTPASRWKTSSRRRPAILTRVGIFNNAAQDWNHTFYWNSMRPNGGGAPAGAIADRIKDSFGDYAKFREAIRDRSGDASSAAAGRGWCRKAAANLKVVKTANADTPMAQWNELAC